MDAARLPPPRLGPASARVWLAVLLPAWWLLVQASRGGPCGDGLETLARNHPDIVGDTFLGAVEHVARHCCGTMSRPAHRLEMYVLYHRLGLSVDTIRALLVGGHVLTVYLVWWLALVITRREWLAGAVALASVGATPAGVAATYVATSSEVFRATGPLCALLVALRAPRGGLGSTAVFAGYAFGLAHKETAAFLLPPVFVAFVLRFRRGAPWALFGLLAATTVGFALRYPIGPLFSTRDPHYSPWPVGPHLRESLALVHELLTPLGEGLIVCLVCGAVAVVRRARREGTQPWREPELAAVATLALCAPLPYAAFAAGARFPNYYHLLGLALPLLTAVLVDRGLPPGPLRTPRARVAAAVAVTAVVGLAGLQTRNYEATRSGFAYCRFFRTIVDPLTPDLAAFCARERSVPDPSPVVVHVGGDELRLVRHQAVWLVTRFCGTRRPVYVSLVDSDGTHRVQRLQPDEPDPLIQERASAELHATLPDLAARLARDRTRAHVAACGPPAVTCTSVDPTTGDRELTLVVRPPEGRSNGRRASE